MDRIVVQKFGGIAPKIKPHLLSQAMAQTASSCDVRSGAIKPIYSDSDVVTLTQTGEVKTISLYDSNLNNFLQFTGDVDICQGPIAGDTTKRTYITGTDMPRVFDNTMYATGGTNYPMTTYRLGIPAPVVAPTAAVGVAGSGTLKNRAWAYTFVRKWASGKVDEGPPSPASNILNCYDNGTINLTTIDVNPHTDSGITHVWIYRILSGTTGAEYQFVKEITIGTTSTTDTVLDTALGDTMVSTYWSPPPDGMTGLIMLPNGSAAGFYLNTLYVSVPYQVHAYPSGNQITIPVNSIVGLGNVGNTIVVCTDSLPYIVVCNDPTVMYPSVINEPHVCLSKRGIVSTYAGVIYPTHAGLVSIGAGGSATVLTKELVTAKEWSAFFPNAIQARWFSNRYVAFYKSDTVNGVPIGNGFIFDPSTGDLTEINSYASAMAADYTTDTLYVVRSTDGVTNYIKGFNANIFPGTFVWRSKQFLSSNPENFGAFKIEADFSAASTTTAAVIAANAALIVAGGVLGAIDEYEIDGIEINGDNLSPVPASDYTPSLTLTYYIDGAQIHSSSVSDNTIHRLPSYVLGYKHEFEISGTVTVNELRAATSVTEVGSTSPGSPFTSSSAGEYPQYAY